MCGDVLPAACYGRAYRELDERGLTLRRHAAPLSPVERAREAEVQQRRAVEEQLRRERLRRDEALLASYGTVADLDAQRDRTLRLQQQALDDARARQRILKARQQELHARSPAAGPPQGGASPPGGQRGGLTTSVGAHPPAAGRSAPPMEVQISLREIESELQTLETVVERKVAEIESTRSRFEAERKRFLELTVERRPEASPREPAAPTQQ
ncbi:MAG: hypothetical protein HY778_05415 [Betaproteobacteria bacterium]|nr:hypothetical protein [Betaproteobacteria bacterium]